MDVSHVKDNYETIGVKEGFLHTLWVPDKVGYRKYVALFKEDATLTEEIKEELLRRVTNVK